MGPRRKRFSSEDKAINLFIDDIYNDQNILKENVIPHEIINSSKGFRQECIGLKPPNKVWAHVTGTDLIRDNDGKFYVLEDNLCVPSGVSYALINRQLMKRNFPEVFQRSNVRQIIDYPDKFMKILNDLSPVEKNFNYCYSYTWKVQLSLFRTCFFGSANGSYVG